MTKLIAIITSASTLIAASTVSAAPKAAAPLSLTKALTRASATAAKPSNLNDQAPAPVWALVAMGVISAAVAILVVVDPVLGDETPDSN